jgi:hypothetical protein
MLRNLSVDRLQLLLVVPVAVVVGAAGVAVGAGAVGLLALRASARRRLMQWPDSSDGVQRLLISLTSWQPPWPPLTEVFSTPWEDE